MSNFCNILQKKCALLTTFVNFPLYFCKFLHHFFLAHFTQTPHAAIQHLFAAQKQTSTLEETEKTAIFPHFLKFKNFHFSIMLICATLRTAISTGTKNRVFVYRQKNPTCRGVASGEAGNKLADVPALVYKFAIMLYCC